MRLFGLQTDYVKRLIKDTIETYSGQWRIIHEAIQNAHDAIQLHEGDGKGTIVVELFVGTNKVTVTDTGRGIPIEEFPTIFTLGGTIKDDPKFRKLLKGSQGVGIKATVFTSDFFEVKTIHGDYKWESRIENCWDFLNEEFNDNVDEPRPRRVKKPGNGTSVSYSLHDYSVKDFLEEIVSEYSNELDIGEVTTENDFKELIEIYFRTQTYLGCVHQLLNADSVLKPITVKVKINFDHPNLETYRKEIITKCPFLAKDTYHRRVIEITFPGTYKDFFETHLKLKKEHKVDRLYENFCDVIENPPNINWKKILIQKLSKEQAHLLIANIKRDPNTNELFFEEDEKLSIKHDKLFGKLNGGYLIVGPRDYLKQYLHLLPKQIISINGLPTNIVISPPRGRGELGYLLNIHLILDLDTTLGYGKRNVPSVVKGQADAFFGDAFNILRRVARGIVGERESKEPDPLPWDKEEEFENYKAPSNIFRELVIPYQLPPNEEQDVICIFHELLGTSIIKGYYPFKSSIAKKYDSLMYISRSHDREIASNISWRDLKFVEFKIFLSEIIEDFKTEKKDIRDIDLVVVWEDDFEGDTEYLVSSLERDDIEPLPAAQKRIRLGSHSCQVLILKDFISTLDK